MSQDKKKRKYNGTQKINIISNIEEYNKIGDPDELNKQSLTSETMTRRKQATLNELKHV